MALWNLKNFLATGDPFFPIFAGKLGALHWTEDMGRIFGKAYGGGLGIAKLIKYFSYMFVWPGIKAAKIVGVVIIFGPLILFRMLKNEDMQTELRKECLPA